MMLVTCCANTGTSPTYSTLREFLVCADVHSTPSVTKLRDGRLWIRFRGRRGANDWSFWLEKGTFLEWLRATGARLYKYHYLPSNKKGVNIAYPSPDIEGWNRQCKGTWEYSLLPLP